MNGQIWRDSCGEAEEKLGGWRRDRKKAKVRKVIYIDDGLLDYP